MYLFIIISLLLIGATWIITSLGFIKRLEEADFKLKEARMNTLKWQLAADFNEADTYIRYNKSLVSWQVVRGGEPYIQVIASYDCLSNTDAEAKALAEELSETINRFRDYGAE